MMDDKKIVNYVLSNHGLLVDKEPVRFQSGQMNRVYDLGHFVLKIGGEGVAGAMDKDRLKGQKKITEILVRAGAKVPKIIEEGEYQDKRYLLIEKLPGQILTHLWPDMKDAVKENIAAQLAEQLKIFHSIKFESFSLKMYLDGEVSTLRHAVAKSVDFDSIDNSKLSGEQRRMVIFLRDFYERNLNILNNGDRSVFVHNDIHFENIFVDHDQLVGIIDLDRWVKASPDYELHKTLDFIHTPFRYVEKRLEPLFQRPLVDVIQRLKKYYPELFNQKDLANRIRLYYVETAIWLLTEYQKGTWGEGAMVELREKFRDFYETDWLEQLLA